MLKRINQKNLKSEFMIDVRNTMILSIKCPVGFIILVSINSPIETNSVTTGSKITPTAY